MSCVALALFLIGPLSEFSWVNAELAQGRASADRIAGVLGARPAVTAVPPAGRETAARRVPVEGRLRLRDLTYGPLDAVDIDIDAGETVGVVAVNPADAVALLHCLGRRADPERGAVELDGRALTTLDLAEARRAILVAEHDADLFEGTLLENVVAAVPAEGRGAVTSAAAMSASGTDEVARSLPDGVDTAVTARGRSLSGGQRQRVALARALAADAPVLVVHEPSTAVDAVTETRMAAGIKAVRSGRTTVLVTNSPALLAVTDRVVLLRDGRVAASGVHGHLAGTHADYRTAVLA
ncbi:ATP-binding cassette domain-containing protein [Streptomyces sp. NPDC059018]|uniref:ATP-binding cassette domain-containing protein n=1 Tax=Streptomyces sp. NPDC059018 TaxID=3346701 RepID=UPI0036DACBE9